MDWFKDVLDSAESADRFILNYDVYETYGQYDYKLTKTWEEGTHLDNFYYLFLTHRDKIILTVSGHDELVDLRTHSARYIYDTTNNCLLET